jgi:hypothetical protein
LALFHRPGAGRGPSHRTARLGRVNDQPKTETGSTKSYTQIDDLKNPPGWFPDMNRHLPMSIAICPMLNGIMHEKNITAHIGGL